MLKIALLGDLHLPFCENAVQYQALEFSIKSINENNPDVIVSLGDITACGDINAAEIFLAKMKLISKPRLMVLGNSDIRNKETLEKIKILEENYDINLRGIRLVGINNADGIIHSDDRKRLLSIDNNTILFMHRPQNDLVSESAEFFDKCCKENKPLAIVCGHLHFFKKIENNYLIQALDPDKAIGEPPCVTYMLIDGKDISFEFDYFPFSLPTDIKDYLGLSCFNWFEDIPFAADNGIKNIELRPGVIRCDVDLLIEKIRYFREKGGNYVSLHMPDFGYNGEITGAYEWEEAIKLANILNVDGVTVHVPMASVEDMQGSAKKIILDFVCEKLSKLSSNCKIGIENMHMTKADTPDNHRRYGYTPYECLEFISCINAVLGNDRVGALLDVGHARNNAPFSQKYNLGAWYSIIGKKTVAYHIHQVILTEKDMENHCKIDNLYGPLISYVGFFSCWNNGILNKAPIFLEIRGGKKEYIPTIKTFLSDNIQ